METQDLTKLEDQIYQEYDKDGCTEILLGVGLFFASAFLEHSLSTSFVVFLPILLIVFKKTWKKTITYPRLGYVKFNEIKILQKKKEKKSILWIGLASIAFILVWVFGVEGLFPKDLSKTFSPYSKLVLSSLIALIILGAAVLRRNKSLYIAGTVALALILIGYQVGFSTGIAILITSFVLLGMGAVRLLSFLRANPRLDDEAQDPHV